MRRSRLSARSRVWLTTALACLAGLGASVAAATQLWSPTRQADAEPAVAAAVSRLVRAASPSMQLDASSAAAPVATPEPTPEAELPAAEIPTAESADPAAIPAVARPPSPPKPPPAAARPGASSCNPPYVVGADGIRRVKRECL